MKRILLLLLTLITLQAPAQPGAGLVAVQAATKYSDTNIGTGNAITFTNPMPVHKVWRVGTEYTGSITVPNNYTSVSWKIINHLTESIVVSGATLSVTWTPPSYDYNCTYDLIVTTTRESYPTIERIFPGEITVLPPVPLKANADIVYTLPGAIGDKDGGWGSGTDRSNIAAYNPSTSYSAGQNVKSGGLYYKSLVGSNVGNNPASSPTQWKQIHSFVIWVEGTYSGATNGMNFYYWYSSDLPIQVYCDNASINTNSYIFRVGSSYNMIIDGSGSESTPYGLDLGNHTTPSNIQRVVINLIDNSQPSLVSGRLVFTGIEVDNGGVSNGGTTWEISTSQSNTWSTPAVRITMLNIYVHDSRDELLYLGHTNDQSDHTPMQDALFYRITAINGGNECMQISSALGKSAMFSNVFLNPGLKGDGFHQNVFQFGGGNDGFVFCQNRAETAYNTNTGSNGKHGNNILCVSNHITSTGKAASNGVNMQITIEQSSVYSTVNMVYTHNTYSIRGSSFTNIPFQLYRSASTTTADKLRLVGNAIVTNTATTKEFPGGWSPGAQLQEDNKQYTSGVTPGFVDYTNKDYHLANTSSPLFATPATVPTIHRLQDYDFEGYKYLPSHPVYGCYSGFELFTGN